MKRSLYAMIITWMLFASLPVKSLAAELLIPVGKIIGLHVSDDTVTVAAFDDTAGSCGKDAGLKIGDEIVKMDGTEVDSTLDVRSALDSCDGDIEMTVRRSGRINTITVTPEQTDQGPRLGIYLRQGIAGIGTVTFYDPETGLFGTLGHGVSDGKGKLLPLKTGTIFDARILSVKKGKCGDPGQLKGSAEANLTLGNVTRNTPQGVFGIAKKGWKGEAIPVAAYEEISTGPATIRSTVSNDSVQEYSVEILKIYPQGRSDGRNFLIKVTDPELLRTTGGIVQGMSGSPLLQDGKIIGAVTHVLVNDPTMGYGIFIENMLDAAG